MPGDYYQQFDSDADWIIRKEGYDPRDPESVKAYYERRIDENTRACIRAAIQKVTISATLNKDSVLPLGTKGPYFRYSDWPTYIVRDLEDDVDPKQCG